MSDEVLVEMSRQIGELNGTMKAFVKSQEEINKDVAHILEKQHERVDQIEKGRASERGFAIGAGLASGGLTGSLFIGLAKLVGGG